MRKCCAGATLILARAASPGAAAEVHGYAPWQLGMTRDQVTAATAEGPYTAVSSTGGLETRNATFQGSKITASFVFGAQGLNHIQLWAYEGSDSAKAFAAFHQAYRYLSTEFGELQSDGSPIPAGLSEAELAARIPEAFKTGTSQSQLSKGGSFQAQVLKM